MTPKILLLQEKQENIENIRASLPDCAVVHVRTIQEAIPLIKQRKFDLIVSAVHLEYDGSVFDFLRSAKSGVATKNIPFVFYCSVSSKFARSVRDGLQIAAKTLGADKYITMENFDRAKLRAEFTEFLPQLKNQPYALRIPADEAIPILTSH